MGFQLLSLFTFVSLAQVTCHAGTIPPQQLYYWNEHIPGTPMPKILWDLIRPEGKTTASSLSEVTRIIKDPSVEKWVTAYVWGSYYKRPGDDDPSPWKDSVDSYRDMFFLEGDLKKGGNLNLLCSSQPANSHNRATFVPRQEVERVPFQSKRFNEILKRYEVEPASAEAEIMKQTIYHCEGPGSQNERKHCATSLESMMDHTISMLGNNVRAVTTEIVERKAGVVLQNYNITEVRRIRGDEAVSCHQFPYVHLVYSCHNSGPVRIWRVSLVGVKDGMEVEGAVICHIDTKDWNPGHLAFRLLKVKPGTVSVCHLLLEGHIAWVRK